MHAHPHGLTHIFRVASLTSFVNIVCTYCTNYSLKLIATDPQSNMRLRSYYGWTLRKHVLAAPLTGFITNREGNNLPKL